MLRILPIPKGGKVKAVPPHRFIHVDPAGFHGGPRLTGSSAGRPNVTGITEAAGTSPHSEGLVIAQEIGLTFQKVGQITDPETLIGPDQNGTGIFTKKPSRLTPGGSIRRTGRSLPIIFTTIPAFPLNPGGDDDRTGGDHQGILRAGADGLLQERLRSAR